MKVEVHKLCASPMDRWRENSRASGFQINLIKKKTTQNSVKGLSMLAQASCMFIVSMCISLGLPFSCRVWKKEPHLDILSHGN